jgi:hypothetical protein
MMMEEMCAMCLDDFKIAGAPVSKCAACAVQRSQKSDEICARCYNSHIQRKGNLAKHTAIKIIHSGEKMLEANDLCLSNIFCSLHCGEPVKLQCITCRGTICCHSCAYSAVHKGHIMVLIAEAAPLARQHMRDADSAPATNAAATVALPTLRLAEIAARRITTELAALPVAAAAALDVVEHARTTVICAINSICSGVSTGIQELVRAKTEALQIEQEVRNDQLTEATAAVSAALNAAAALGDVDAVVHSNAFIRRISAVRHLIQSMPPAPQTAAAISVNSDGLDVALTALQGVMTLQKSGYCGDPLAVSPKALQREEEVSNSDGDKDNAARNERRCNLGIAGAEIGDVAAMTALSCIRSISNINDLLAEDKGGLMVLIQPVGEGGQRCSALPLEVREAALPLGLGGPAVSHGIEGPPFPTSARAFVLDDDEEESELGNSGSEMQCVAGSKRPRDARESMHIDASSSKATELILDESSSKRELRTVCGRRGKHDG